MHGSLIFHVNSIGLFEGILAPNRRTLLFQYLPPEEAHVVIERRNSFHSEVPIDLTVACMITFSVEDQSLASLGVLMQLRTVSRRSETMKGARFPLHSALCTSRILLGMAAVMSLGYTKYWMLMSQV
jgi:hypothetical protein